MSTSPTGGDATRDAYQDKHGRAKRYVTPKVAPNRLLWRMALQASVTIQLPPVKQAGLQFIAVEAF
eukprot:6455637-Amphidinium_carterae.1